VANTDFEGGDDDHGYGDCIFWSFMRNPAIGVACFGLALALAPASEAELPPAEGALVVPPSIQKPSQKHQN
jgi:hypothetical protein